MFRLLRRSAVLFSLPMLSPEGDPPAGGAAPTPVVAPEVKFDEAQQKKLNDLLASERKATEDRVKAAIAAEADANKKKTDEDREREEATKRGEFDKVRLDLEGKVQTTESERDRIKSENATFATIFETQYAAGVKDIPEKIWAVVKPADDAPLAERITALEKAKELAGIVGTTAPRGLGPSPKPGDPAPTTEEAYEKARRNPAYSI